MKKLIIIAILLLLTGCVKQIHTDAVLKTCVVEKRIADFKRISIIYDTRKYDEPRPKWKINVIPYEYDSPVTNLWFRGDTLEEALMAYENFFKCYKKEQIVEEFEY